MKKTILLHDAQNHISQNINRCIIELQQKSHNIIRNPVHGNLFSIYQYEKPEYIFLSASEYTQEFQDFLTDHSYDTNVFLFIDNEEHIQNSQLVEFWNSRSSLKIIANKNHKNRYTNCIAEYGDMYNEKVFYDRQLQRNDRIAIILSNDNNKNDILQEILYPNVFDHKLVVFNNPDFKSPVNLGILNSSDLAIVLNIYGAVLDMDQKLYLQAQACKTKYYDISNIQVKEAILNQNFKISNLDLNNHTYLKFVTEKILPHIRN